MDAFPILVKYRGGLASRNVLPAYEAGDSLAGFTRMVEIATYYAAHQRVRHRSPSSNAFSVFVRPARPGSFEFLLELAASYPLFTAVATPLAMDGLYDIINYIFLKCTGQASPAGSPSVKNLTTERPWDIEALVDAIEPSARRFHQPIGSGAVSILVVNGNNNSIDFNAATKEYVNTSVKNENVRGKAFSVSSFNVISGYGRAFDREEGRTIPFQVQDDADASTKRVIAASLNSYANDNEGWIELVYTTVDGPNERPKKLLVHGAREIGR